MNLNNLPPMQQLILAQLILGKTNQQVADATGRSIKTVKAHLTSLFRNVGCYTAREVIARYYREDWPASYNWTAPVELPKYARKIRTETRLLP